MRARTVLFFSLCAALSAATLPALAQPVLPWMESAEAQIPPQDLAAISATQDVPVGRPILLDGSMSRIVGSNPQFLWFVSGQSEPISRTVDAIFTPEQPGTLRFRLILRTVVDGNQRESHALHEVTVYRRKIVLLADSSVPSEKLDAQAAAASGAGLYLRIVRTPVPSVSAERFTRALADQMRTLRGADAVILWTDSMSGLQSFLQAVQADSARLAELKNQNIVLVTTRRLATVAQTARAPFAVLQPQRIILLGPEALSPLLLSPDVPTFLSSAKERDLSVFVLDASTPPVVPWQVLTLLVNAMLVRGIGSQTILLLLMLPVIATILSFLKQVVGVTTFGLFAPSIIALSFLALGWWAGLLSFFFILIIGTIARLLVYRLHILYIPKLAIIITIISLSLLLLLAANLWFGVILSRDTVFVLLVMATLAESFLSAKAEQGWLSALSGILQTLVSALLCVLVTQLPSFQSLVIAYPEIILFTIPLNIIIGRYTGLRLSEYIRFRELLKHLGSEE